MSALAARFAGECCVWVLARRELGAEQLLLCVFAVPLGIGALALQASLYDVPGGYRAVMFDRFQGVKDQVSCLTYRAKLFSLRIRVMIEWDPLCMLSTPRL